MPKAVIRMIRQRVAAKTENAQMTGRLIGHHILGRGLYCMPSRGLSRPINIDIPRMNLVAAIIAHGSHFNPGAPFRDRCLKVNTDTIVATSLNAEGMGDRLYIDPDLDR